MTTYFFQLWLTRLEMEEDLIRLYFHVYQPFEYFDQVALDALSALAED